MNSTHYPIGNKPISKNHWDSSRSISTFLSPITNDVPFVIHLQLSQTLLFQQINFSRITAIFFFSLCWRMIITSFVYCLLYIYIRTYNSLVLSLSLSLLLVQLLKTTLSWTASINLTYISHPFLSFSSFFLFICLFVLHLFFHSDMCV